MRGRIILVSFLCSFSPQLMSSAWGQVPNGDKRGTPAQRQQAASQIVNNTGRLPGQPEWFPLPVEHEKYLDSILKYWEWQAAQVQRFKCKFDRWEYDPVMLPAHPGVAATISQGNIQYQSPDKGKYEVVAQWDVKVQQQGNTTVPVLDANGKPQYEARREVMGNHWVCDGQSIFEFDRRNKQIVKRPLPPNMQGKQIADGPLPFLFGAKAHTLKERYWIRALPPQKEGYFYLEAIPKRREDAADFTKIHVMFDDQEYLLRMLVLFDRAGGRESYDFKEHEKNWNLLPEKINPWHQNFYAPKPDIGWKMVEEPFQAGPAMGPPAGPLPAAGGAPPAAPRQATQGPVPAGQRR
jgi:TIGR03009 family protein